MRVKTVELVGFKRFDNLTINLGPTPQKIIGLIGPNGCGKSSIFDAFELLLPRFRSYGSEGTQFYSKSFFYRTYAVGRKIGYNSGYESPKMHRL